MCAMSMMTKTADASPKGPGRTRTTSWVGRPSPRSFTALAGRSSAAVGPYLASADEDLLAVPVEVLAARCQRASGQQQCLAQRRPPVELPCQLVGLDGVCERRG